MPEPHSHGAGPGRTAPPPAPDGRAASPAPGTGGRARRSAPRGVPGANETRRLLNLAVWPPVAVAAVAAFVVGYLLRPPAGVALTPGVPWAVVAGGLLLVGAVVSGAAVAAGAEARARNARVTALRRENARGAADLTALALRVAAGEAVRPPGPRAPGPAAGDGLRILGEELAVARHAAQTALAEASAARHPEPGGSEEKLEVFVNLARRLQSLVHRQIEHLDELEHEVEDPDLLKGLFHVDHLATRMRRHAENLAVLGGATSRRQWSRPVEMSEVLRSSIAEVQHYSRVRLVPPIEGRLRGHAVADVIHLLAELVENATVFSAPQTQVVLRAQYVTAGLAVEVEDRGLGLAPDVQDRMNALLTGAERMDVAALVQDGRIGLLVVSALAQRHDIVVQLQSNIYGGVQAVLVLPHALLGNEEDERPTEILSASPAAAGGGPPPPVGPVPPPPAPAVPQAAHPEQASLTPTGRVELPRRRSAARHAAPEPAQHRPGA
ncbi:sensor histidine kinase, partial [Streptomyces bohaiensis]|uniref:sensor histidine kinase n=1 Tax=Streptomyces bohaiensis TaxID=1431344 RepID=UPI001ADD9FC4